MWSGFSSEIETGSEHYGTISFVKVACGAASRLRLKQVVGTTIGGRHVRRMWSGFSSEIETDDLYTFQVEIDHVACGAASRLRLKPPFRGAFFLASSWSHVERLLV